MDLTILAIPGFFGSMAYEARWLRRRAEREGPSPVDYERSDTIASLVMGTGSLVIPPLAGKLAREFEWGRGRWARPLLAFGVGAAAATAVADAIARSNEREAGSVEATPVEPVGPVETAPVETAPVDRPRGPVVRLIGGPGSAGSPSELPAVQRSRRSPRRVSARRRHGPPGLPPNAFSSVGCCGTGAVARSLSPPQ